MAVSQDIEVARTVRHAAHDSQRKGDARSLAARVLDEEGRL
jgi:hypothetical protein